MQKSGAKIPPRKKQNKKLPYNSGSIGPGMAFALLALLVVLSGGLLMVGNIFPNRRSPAQGQQVIIQSGKSEPAKSNLQLNYFIGITYTPTPMPTTVVPTQQPTPDNSVPPQPGGGRGFF